MAERQGHGRESHYTRAYGKLRRLLCQLPKIEVLPTMWLRFLYTRPRLGNASAREKMLPLVSEKKNTKQIR